MNPSSSEIGYSAPYELGKENYGGWEYCEIRPYVNESIYNSLPSELKEVIINTRVVSGHGGSDSNNFTTNDKLYLLSSREVFEYLDDDTASEFSRQLDYYLERDVTYNSNYLVTKKMIGNESSKWWLRTPHKPGGGFSIVQYSGGHDTGYASTELYGVSPAFRIG